MTTNSADVIICNGKLATQDDRRSFAQAAAIRDGKFIAVGSDREVMAYRDAGTKVIDLHKRTVIPGLNDSHLHLIRGGLNYNLEGRAGFWRGGRGFKSPLPNQKTHVRTGHIANGAPSSLSSPNHGGPARRGSCWTPAL
jgi:predicted amidohydrolase YtcJ